jgi:hypothetical protein
MVESLAVLWDLLWAALKATTKAGRWAAQSAALMAAPTVETKADLKVALSELRLAAHWESCSADW